MNVSGRPLRANFISEKTASRKAASTKIHRTAYQ